MRAQPLSRGVVVLLGALALVAVALLAVPLRASAASASMWLTRANGSSVPENGVVKTGEAITIHVKGFAANATVLLQFGPVELPTSVDTDASGAGSVAFTAPAIKSDVYVFTASSDSDSATFVVSLFNPKNPKQTATPTPTPTPKASTTTHTSTSSSSSSHSTSSSSGSSSSNLAKTGPVQQGYWLAALVLLVVGGAMVKVAAPVLLGRHERIGGAHVRRAGHRLRD